MYLYRGIPLRLEINPDRMLILGSAVIGDHTLNLEGISLPELIARFQAVVDEYEAFAKGWRAKWGLTR